MPQTLLKLTTYNTWANDKFIACLSKLDEKILHAEMQSSFSTLLDTCKHLWLGELGWLSRMQGRGWQTTALDNFSGSPAALFAAWQKTSKAYPRFVEKEDLEALIKFEHDGVEYAIARRDIIHTIITHGNYHRGQLVTMLRQQGVTEIPKTDYIEWVREQARLSV